MYIVMETTSPTVITGDKPQTKQQRRRANRRMKGVNELVSIAQNTPAGYFGRRYKRYHYDNLDAAAKEVHLNYMHEAITVQREIKGIMMSCGEDTVQAYKDVNMHLDTKHQQFVRNHTGATRGMVSQSFDLVAFARYLCKFMEMRHLPPSMKLEMFKELQSDLEALRFINHHKTHNQCIPDNTQILNVLRETRYRNDKDETVYKRAEKKYDAAEKLEETRRRADLYNMIKSNGFLDDDKTEMETDVI